MKFGVMTHFDSANDGQNLFLKTKMAHGRCPGTSGGRYTQSDSAGDRTGTLRMSIGIMYIGVSWRKRLNRLCAATMRPYVKWNGCTLIDRHEH